MSSEGLVVWGRSRLAVRELDRSEILWCPEDQDGPGMETQRMDGMSW